MENLNPPKRDAPSSHGPSHAKEHRKLTYETDASSRPACPAWCTRRHIGSLSRVVHRAMVADIELQEMRIVVSLACTESLADRSVVIAPHMYAELSASDGALVADLELSAGRVRLLAQLLGTQGFPELLAEVFVSAADALDENSHSGSSGLYQAA